MAVTASWDEYNGTPAYASPSKEGISHTHWGSVDEADLDPLSNYVTAGENSFNKQQAIRFSGFAGETITNFFIWCETLSSAGVIVDINGNDTNDRLNWKDSGGKTTAAPSTAAISAGAGMPSSIPVSSNLGGSPVTSDGDGTNIFLTQIAVDAESSHAGEGLVISFQYDDE